MWNLTNNKGGSMSPFKIKVMIKKWINKYFKKKEENIYSKTLLKVDINKLFRGHSATVWTYADTIMITNTYFNATCTQSIDTKTGIVNINLRSTAQRRKWVMELLNKLEKDLDRDVQLELLDGNYKYHIGWFSEASYIKDTDMAHMLTHTDTINKVNVMSKNLSKILKNLKHCDYEQLVTMIMNLNSKNDTVFKIDHKLLA